MSSIEIFHKIVSILISLAMLVNAYFIKRLVGTWLTPGGIFSLFWFVFTFAPLVLLFDVPINPIAVLFIAICVVLFSWTFCFFKWKKAFALNIEKPKASEAYDTPFMRLFFKLSMFIAVFSTIAQVMAQGFTLEDIFLHPLATSGKYTAMRYDEEIKSTIFNTLGNVFSYVAVLIGGLLFGSVVRKKRKIKALLCFLPAILIMFTQGAKGLLFLALFLFIGSLLITSLFNNKLNLFKFKNNVKVFKVTALLFVMLYFSFMSRGLHQVTDKVFLFNKLRQMFASYALGHLYAFSDWLTAYLGGVTELVYDVKNNFVGFYTFYFIGKKLVPQDELIMGTYGEYFKYENLLQSNIYTIFRGLIQDFTIPGAIIFIIVNGFLLHLVFYQFLIKKKPAITAAILIFMIGHFYNSLYISFLTWNIPVFLFVVFAVVLYLNKYKFVFNKKKG